MSRPLRVAVLLLLACGCGDPTYTPPDGIPRIHEFSVTPVEVLLGESVTIRWRVDRASEIRIEGLPNADALPAMGEREVVVDQTLALTLVAVGSAAERRAELRIAPAGVNAVELISFDAQPRRVRPGEPVHLRWKTTNARRVRITSDVIEEVLLESQQSEGEFIHRPNQSGALRLTADGFPAAVSDAVVIEVVPGRPIIHSFAAVPPITPAGALTFLEWEATGASGFQVQSGNTNIDTNNNFAQLRLPGGTHEVSLLAFGFTPVAVTATTTAIVIEGAADVPLIRSVDAYPPRPSHGSDVRVTYEVVDGAEVRLIRTAGPPEFVPGPRFNTVILKNVQGGDLIELAARRGEVTDVEGGFVFVGTDFASPIIQSAQLDLVSAGPPTILRLEWRTLDTQIIQLTLPNAPVAVTSTLPAGSATFEVFESGIAELGAFGNSSERAVRFLPINLGLTPQIPTFTVPNEVREGLRFPVEFDTDYADRVLLHAPPEWRTGRTESTDWVIANGVGNLDVSLTAKNNANVTSSTRSIAVLPRVPWEADVEPNHEPYLAAGPFFPINELVIDGSADIDGDWFVVSLLTGYLTVEVAPPSGCPPTGLAVDLMSLDVGGPQPPTLSFDRVGQCPTLTAAMAPEIARLAGRIAVGVRLPTQSTASSAPYQLRATRAFGACGDGTLNADEQCDDGNLIDFDGCSQCVLDGLSTTTSLQVDDPALFYLQPGQTHSLSFFTSEPLEGDLIVRSPGGICAVDLEVTVRDTRGPVVARTENGRCPEISLRWLAGDHAFFISGGSANTLPRFGPYEIVISSQ